MAVTQTAKVDLWDGNNTVKIEGQRIFGGIAGELALKDSIINDLLLHFDADFTDSSGNGRDFTAEGGAVIDASIKKFGAGSFKNPATSNNWVKILNGDFFIVPANTDFTLEFWVRFINYGSFVGLMTSSQDGTIGTNGMWLEFGTNRNSVIKLKSGSLFTIANIINTTGLQTGRWYKLVYDRFGTGANNLRLMGFSDVPGDPLYDAGGQTVLIGQLSYNGQINDAGQPLYFGRYLLSSTGSCLNGYMDEVRIRIGTSIYSGNNFTPEASAFPDGGFPSDSPSPAQQWNSYQVDTVIDMSTIHIPELMNAGDAGSITYQYASNGGALNGVDLTQAQLKAVGDITVTDANQSLLVVPKLVGNGSQKATCRAYAHAGLDISGIVVTCDYADNSDLRFGVTQDFGARTGSAHIPDANDVRKDVPVDATVGNYEPADEDNHALGDSYGSLGTEFTGTKALTPFKLPVDVVLEDSEILIFEGCD